MSTAAGHKGKSSEEGPQNAQSVGKDTAEDALAQLSQKVQELKVEEPQPKNDDKTAETKPKEVPQDQPAPATAASAPASALPQEKTMIILRGVPGSGKSTLARTLLEAGQGKGVVMSSDDFFMRNGKYEFNPRRLEDAHNWNQQRVLTALKEGTLLVIVDNTHTQKWEARPYVRDALKFGYKVKFAEPDTPWKRNAAELVKRNVHGVPLDAIERMLGRWENDFTVESVMNSHPPRRR